MNAPASTPSIVLLAEVVDKLERWTGIDLGRGSGFATLARYLATRPELHGHDALARYVHGLMSPRQPEAQRLIEAITVCHSSFYRDPDQLAAVADVLRADPGRTASVWIPGCATGEDAYSLALVAESVGRRVSIVATDINAHALAFARRGEYGTWSMRGLPSSYALTAGDDGVFAMPSRLRGVISFSLHNLMDPPLAAPGGWDVIVCRNVLMYFLRHRADEVVRQLASVLRPGGHLFLGASDVLHRAPPPLRFATIGARHVLQRPLEAAAPPPLERDAPAPLLPPPRTARGPRPAELTWALDALDRGDTARAIEGLLRELERDPLRLEARLLAGIAYHLAGDWLQAIVALRGALLLDPALWPAEMYLGFALARLGEHHDAARALKRCGALAAARRPLALSPSVADWLEGWRVDAISCWSNAS